MNSSPSQLYVIHAVKASLVEYIDKYMMIILRDGTVYIGELRTFDQFTNVVLEDAWIRNYIDGNKLYEKYIGTLLIRGDNVVFFAEIDPQKDSKMKRIDEKEYQQLKKNQKSNEKDFATLFSWNLTMYHD